MLWNRTEGEDEATGADVIASGTSSATVTMKAFTRSVPAV
jgi:hypothetical protein